MFAYFLAQNVMKLMSIHILMNYDVKYPEGVENWPPDIKQHLNIMPNIMSLLLFKGI
jgi:hypothetical protein